MLAELSTQKYRGCSGKVAVVFSLFFFFFSERKEGLFVLFLCLLRKDSTGEGGVEQGEEEALRQYMKRDMKCALGFALPPDQQKFVPGSGFPDFVSEYFQQVESSLEGCQGGPRDCHTETTI